MLLAIDCGNTRTKWAVFNATGEVCNQDACLNAEISTIDLSPLVLGYERVMISNVAGERYAAELIKNISPYKLPVHWIKSTSQICDVLNRYSSPETLGTDRWAALIAAWHIKQAPCVVVNAGTAVTIDALTATNNQAEFIGGLILPGFNLMQQSLGRATAQLPMPASADSAQHSDIFAKNTEDAMCIGALKAISGAIKLMADALQAQCQQSPTIIISGGDAQTIKNNLSGDVTNLVLIVDNLVLRGLFLIEKFMQKNITKSEQQ
ncbi:type III pantothenate kinase [Methylotenera sp.]|uniref:type III pantothenate kinase n=1 Tax=Methylotenera sp. TaxID=2051956 RepID=UPI0027314FB9|nr:type III pantothenate kinase [Methylotenera sp.]MDP2072327.1 type III pantothenate kinase [Methylotenera sp.]MDP3005126.1 type III pantothenate kinase [Methylotenera sp.]